MTQSLKERWTNMKDEFVKENKPILLVEREEERSEGEGVIYKFMEK